MISLYGTTELIYVQQHFPVLPDGFWLNLFPRTVTSDREEIMFERLDYDNRRLAPFVSPNVQGRIMRRQGYSAQSFKPAYVKPKHVIVPTDAIARMAGEPLLGGLSMQARFDAHVVNSLRLEREMIERRLDWMASKAVIDGMVTVEGDDYPTVTIDFNRDASLTATLLTTARWDQGTTTPDPLTDLATMSDAAFTLGNGPITDIVFGSNAWKNFIKNPAVLELLSTLRRGSTSTFNVTPVTTSNYQNMGQIVGSSGSWNLWRYSNWYSETDSEGNLTVRQFLDPNDVVGYGGIVDGVQAFGAIMDADANFLAEATIYPKMWREPDPSAVYTMSQSAPLMVPTNPNNTFKLTVIT